MTAEETTELATAAGVDAEGGGGEPTGEGGRGGEGVRLGGALQLLAETQTDVLGRFIMALTHWRLPAPL